MTTPQTLRDLAAKATPDAMPVEGDDTAALLDVPIVALKAATLTGLLDRLEAAERALRHIERALEQDPTIEEIREYGLDGATNPTGYLFNNLQWRLDLIRAALSQPHSAEEDRDE